MARLCPSMMLHHHFTENLSHPDHLYCISSCTPSHGEQIYDSGGFHNVCQPCERIPDGLWWTDFWESGQALETEWINHILSSSHKHKMDIVNWWMNISASWATIGKAPPGSVATVQLGFFFRL